MRKKTTWTLVVAGAALLGRGEGRAQDAEQPASTTRGSIVLAVGDKVHGYLRGGETHALQVHLAKGDVYSFGVNANKRGDPLTMHLSLLDPSGREINADARVMHAADGKKITVGPFKAPQSGTYVMELSAQGWHSGDYWGTSSVRGANRTVVRLPASGQTVDVNVAAGSRIRVRSGTLTSFVMATPGAPANTISGTDPLVASLRAKGLASGETGTYQFAAPGARGATVEITKPQWKATVVEVPTLPDDPTRLAQFDFVLNGWKAEQAAASVSIEGAAQRPASLPSRGLGAPVAVNASNAGAATSALFLGTDVNAMTAIGDFLLPGQTSTPPSTAPTPATSTAAGTPTETSIGLPRLKGADMIGSTQFLLNPAWRDVPWRRFHDSYPSYVASRLLPSTPEGSPADVAVSAPATIQYFVDGHRVEALLATGGESVVQWTYSGSVRSGGRTWDLEGSWTVWLHAPAAAATPLSPPAGRSACTFEGRESVRADGVSESIVVTNLVLNPTIRFCDPTGRIVNRLSARDYGLSQSVEREFLPMIDGHAPGVVPADFTDVPIYSIGAKPIVVRTNVVDPSTPPDGEDRSEREDFQLLD